MKKILLAICIFTLASQSSFATVNRVNALGGETAMITDDDTNIDLFPQHINRQNLVRLSSIQSTTPDYAVITGTSGDKWGLYGGTVERNDFLNVFRSLDANSAVKLGIAFGRLSEEDNTNNNEPTPGNSSATEKNSYYNLAINGIYGTNKADMELAIGGFFSYGPNAIGTVTGNGSAFAGPFGSYDKSITNGTTTTKTDAEGNNTFFGGGAAIRKPMKIAIFNKVFASGSASYLSRSSSASTGAVKLEDDSLSSFSLRGKILMFDEKKIGEKSRVIYGIGAEGSLSRTSFKNKVTSNNAKNTNLSITGPQVRMGIESNLKYGIIRFGLSRDFTLLSYNKNSDVVAGGANNNTNSDKRFSIATNGAYTVSTGFGMEYNNLKLDIALRSSFWLQGPQMIFNSQSGTIATSADVLYSF